MAGSEEKVSNFIETLIRTDLEAGRYERVQTRFPPEPNGFLHIGHAKAICVNFEMAARFGGKCNLRLDDTNPAKEEQRYTDGIVEDVHWLGFDWEDRLFHASDYYDQLYSFAQKLIRDGKAYVDDLSADEIREHRGTLTEPGKESPYRDRPVEESLDLLGRMKAGEFPDGTRTLRAKIDMAAGNINMRDPVLYRILHKEHPRTGDSWCIYPTYDFAHGQSDSIESITHSLCSLEFEDHRPLYDWLTENLEIYRPRQIEFARLRITHTVLSKRKLLRMVDEGTLAGWDDPRMPTLRGMRRRGYPPQAIRAFCDMIGVAKQNSTVDFGMLEHCVREHLNRVALRFMCVLRPLKVVLTNYPEGQVEMLEAINNPENEADGTRQIPFSRELYIEQTDFMEDPPKKFFRMRPGGEVRLRYGYFIRCEEVIKNDDGEVVELRCTYDPETRGGQAPDGRKVRGTIHWVSAAQSVAVEARLYDHLFKESDAAILEKADDIAEHLNSDSLTALADARAEPLVGELPVGQTVQFERHGYFCADPESHPDGPRVFNRTATLRDTWAKIQKKG